MNIVERSERKEKRKMIDTKLLKKGKPVLICGKEKATVYSNWTKRYPKVCTVQTVIGAQKIICYISDLSLDESRITK